MEETKVTYPVPTYETQQLFFTKSKLPRGEKLHRLAKTFERAGTTLEKGLKGFARGAEKFGLTAGKELVAGQKLLVELRLAQLKAKEASGIPLTQEELASRTRLEAVKTRDIALAELAQKKLEQMKMSREEQVVEAQRLKAQAETKLKELLESGTETE